MFIHWCLPHTEVSPVQLDTSCITCMFFIMTSSLCTTAHQHFTLRVCFHVHVCVSRLCSVLDEDSGNRSSSFLVLLARFFIDSKVNPHPSMHRSHVCTSPYTDNITYVCVFNVFCVCVCLLVSRTRCVPGRQSVGCCWGGAKKLGGDDVTIAAGRG